MSRLLLIILLFCVALDSKPQVILNEIHTEVKRSTESEFFELFNTSTDPAGVNLDCYSLVVPYITSSNTVGVYLLDFPNVTIQARSYLVATSATKIVGGNIQFNTQSKTNVVASFSWNLLNVPNQQPLNGSLKNFVPVSGLGGIITTNNLFAPTTGQTLGGPILGVFLFKNSEYINGFLAGYSSSSVPNTIQQLGQISNLINQCGSYSIDFSKIKTAERSGESIGSSNGYRRSGDGLCGSWVKSASGESPGEKNGTTTSTPLSSGALNLGAYEGFNCNGKLEVLVSSQLSTGFYPITITVVKDINANSAVDLVGTVKDEILFTQVITGPMNTPLELSSVSTANNIIVVYQTSIGCIDRVALAKAPSGSYTTTAKRICNTIEYTITGYTEGTSAVTAAPLNVQFYQDLGKKGTFELGTDILIGTTAISGTDVNAGTKIFQIPEAYSSDSLLVVYSSANYSCFISKAEVPQPQPASTVISTEQFSNCGGPSSPSLISFKLTNLAGAAANYGYPLTVDLYYANNLTTKIATDTIAGITGSGEFIIPVTDRMKNFSISYTAVGNCFNANYGIPAACTITPVTFSSFTAQRNAANNNQMVLSWTTAMEQNNKGFYVQRMTDGTWDSIGFVRSAASGGNSMVPVKYHFTEINLFNGSSFYRLLQVDHDGKTGFSDVKAVYGPGKEGCRLLIAPNPVYGGSTTITFPTSITREILLFDLNGRVIQKWQGFTASRLIIDSLKPGLYTLKVSATDKAPPVVQKIIVQ